MELQDYVALYSSKKPSVAEGFFSRFGLNVPDTINPKYMPNIFGGGKRKKYKVFAKEGVGTAYIILRNGTWEITLDSKLFSSYAFLQASDIDNNEKRVVTNNKTLTSAWWAFAMHCIIHETLHALETPIDFFLPEFELPKKKHFFPLLNVVLDVHIESTVIDETIKEIFFESSTYIFGNKETILKKLLDEQQAILWPKLIFYLYLFHGVRSFYLDVHQQIFELLMEIISVHQTTKATVGKEEILRITNEIYELIFTEEEAENSGDSEGQESEETSDNFSGVSESTPQQQDPMKSTQQAVSEQNSDTDSATINKRLREAEKQDGKLNHRENKERLDDEEIVEVSASEAVLGSQLSITEFNLDFVAELFTQRIKERQLKTKSSSRGQRLNINAFLRKSQNPFYETSLPKSKLVPIRVVVILDNSGSVEGGPIHNIMSFGKYFHKALIEADIPHEFYVHTTVTGSRGGHRAIILDISEDDLNSGFYDKKILSIGPRNNYYNMNADGPVLKALQERNSRRKEKIVYIVVSDGQPSASKTKTPIEEYKDAIADIASRGNMVIAIAADKSVVNHLQALHGEYAFDFSNLTNSTESDRLDKVLQEMMTDE